MPPTVDLPRTDVVVAAPSAALPSAGVVFAGPLADVGKAPGDPRALRILAKSIYRELRQSGLAEENVMALAGELLGLVTVDVRGRRSAP